MFLSKAFCLTTYKKLFFLVLFISLWGTCCFASAVLDSRYRLDATGLLPPVDNMGGVYNKAILKKLEQELSHYPFIKIKPLKEASLQTRIGKTPLGLALYEPALLKNLASDAGSQTLIRTNIHSKQIGSQKQISFSFELVLANYMIEVLNTAQFEVSLTDWDLGLELHKIHTPFKEALFQLFQPIPFIGHIIGVDLKTIVINLGKDQKVKTGDVFQVSTIKATKRHPITKVLSEWDVDSIGSIQIEHVENGLSFAKVISTEQGRSFETNQKLLKPVLTNNPTFIAQVMNDKPQTSHPSTGVAVTTPKNKKPAEVFSPHETNLFKGWLAPSLLGGVYNYTFSSNSQSKAALEAGGFSAGFKQEVQLWFNKSSFVKGMLEYSRVFLKDAAETGLPSLSLVNLGATYGLFLPLGDESIMPHSWVEIGFRQNMLLPFTSYSSEYLGQLTYRSIIVGLGTQLHFVENHFLDLQATFRIIGDVPTFWLKDTNTVSIQEITFSLAYQMAISKSFHFLLSAQFQDMALLFEKTNSIRQLRMIFGPKVLAYF